MTKKLVNGVLMDLTPEEETERNIREQALIDGAFDREIARLREQRNSLLAATDFYALQDVTMSEDITTYRQELRDLPSGLTTVEEVQAVTFPVKP